MLAQEVNNRLLLGRQLREQFHLGGFLGNHLRLPSHSIEQVLGTGDCRSLIVHDETVAALGELIGDPAGNYKHVAAVAGGDVGSDQCPTLVGTLHHHCAVAQGSDDAVARKEVATVYLILAGVVAHHCPALLHHACSIVAMLGRVNLVQSTSLHPHGGNTTLERGTVGVDVGAIGKPAHYHQFILKQL